MFDNLIESKAKKQRNTGGTIFSIVFHTIIGIAAVYGTVQAKQELEKPRAERVEFIEVKKDEPPPPKVEQPPPPDITVAPPPPKGFQILTAPIKIPDVLPDIDLSKRVTDEADFSGRGVAGGIAKGVVGGTPQPYNPEQTYFDFQVEKQVQAVPGTVSPRYPDMLRNAGVEGDVLVQFVVDTSGRADMSTFRVLRATHDLFANAVRQDMPRFRFYPAEVGGRKVRQHVQMPIVFSLNR
jgi:periplasmic protein TonB